MSQVCTVNPNTLGRTNFFQTPPGHTDYASIQQAPGMASGIKAFRCYIQTGVTGTSSGDQPGGTADSPNGKNRTEALIAGGQVGSSSQDFSDSANGIPGYNPKAGQTYWHRWRFRIEAGSQLPSTATYNWHLTQTNSLDSNSHYGGMSLKKDKNAMVFENPGTVWTLAMSSLQMDRWYDIVWKVFWSTGASGTHTMWVDGVQQQTATGATMAAQGVYAKFGAYRIDPGVAGHVTIWHSGFWVRTTQAELVNVIPGLTDTGFPGTGSTGTAPVANFSVPSTIVVGTPVSFTSSSTGSPAPTLQWQEDGVNVSTAQTYTTTLTDTNPTTIGLTATNASGTNTKTVTVTATPVTPPTGTPTAFFDGLSNPSLTSTSFSPWRAYNHSNNGTLRMYAANAVSDPQLPPNLPARLRFETNDNRVVGDYFVNTADNPDTLTVRSQLETPRVIGATTEKFIWLNDTRIIVMQFMHDYPILSNPSGTPSPYDPNAVPFAGFATTFGQPYGGSSGNGIGIHNDPDGVNVGMDAEGNWTRTLPRRRVINFIVRRHFSSAVGAADGWDEYWFSLDGDVPVKQTFPNGTTRSPLWANIRAGINDDPIGNEIHVLNYHRGYMPTWDGIHYVEFTHLKVYRDQDVTNISDVFPPPIGTAVTPVPDPVANFTVPASIQTGQQVTFQSTSQNATALQWKVDGVNVGTSPTLPWTFTDTANHTVALTATGQTGTTPSTKTVTVTATTIISVGEPVRAWTSTDSRDGIDAAPVLAVPANAEVLDRIYWTLITASHTRVLTGSLPSGMTIVSDPGANGNDRSWIIAKTYQSGDPTSWTLTFDTVATGGWATVPVAVYNTQPATGGTDVTNGVWQVASRVDTTAALTHTVPATSARGSDGFVLAIITDDANGLAQTPTPSSGSLFANFQRSDLKANIAVAIIDQPAGGAAAATTWTLDQSTQANVYAISFNVGGIPAVTNLTFTYA
jgi:PKD repeat protein